MSSEIHAKGVQKWLLRKWTSPPWWPKSKAKIINDHVYRDGDDIGTIEELVNVLKYVSQRPAGVAQPQPTTKSGSQPGITKVHFPANKPAALQVPLVLLVKMRQRKPDVTRLVVLKTVEERSNTATGNELQLWKEASRSTEFVLPCLGLTVYSYGNLTIRCAVAPYMKNGDLDAVLDKRSLWTLERAHQWLDQIISGFKFLHGANIVHGDLKPDNVLITDTMQAVISDFGLSRFSGPSEPGAMSTAAPVRTIGNSRYMAPEIHTGRICMPECFDPAEGPGHVQQGLPGDLSKSKENDIWAIGMLILHVLSGEIPWGRGMVTAIVTQRHADGQRPPYPGEEGIVRGIDFALWRLAMDCWHPLPRHRPTIEKVHEFVRKPMRALHAPIADLRKVVTAEVPDLTQEINSVSTAPIAVTCMDAGYVSYSAQWAPQELSPCVRVVRLTRRDNSCALTDGWSTELLSEVIGWRRVRHTHLVPLLGVCQVDGKHWFSVSPNWEAYSYRAWLNENETGVQTRACLLLILRDVASALDFLHCQKPLAIVHGAVCASNIYMAPSSKSNNDDTMWACLGNFSSMRQVGDEEIYALRQDLDDYAALYRELLQSRYHFPGDESNNKPSISAIDQVYIGCLRRNISTKDLPGLIMGLVTEVRKGGLRVSDQ
ncbi:kinase-like protein [Exidia glandulosa HHB12029]|uniref:Kinase-like protein n=1 Tax=Exidia glandulosa HHB12029 TaxID=1314781 RepID=A0A165DGG8_EXIGL|nr:kinase-like protein [Exidia glandulosa HHB12029]